MFLATVAIVVGFILLALGADRFVKGAAALARNFGISPLLIGLTIVAFGTSAPEVFVAVTASLQGNPGLAIGNALGSNIANIGLVLGLAAIISPLDVHSAFLKREYPLLLLVMCFASLLFLDGYISITDGILLLMGFGFLTLWMIRQGMQEDQGEVLGREFQAEIPRKMPTQLATFYVILGLILLPMSSEFLVWGSVKVAHYFGVPDLVIGLTIIAIGTSLPEIAAAITGAIQGEDDIVIGNIIGSNMFNLLAVLPWAGLLSPTEIHRGVLLRDIPAMFLFTLILYCFSLGFQQNYVIRRRHGIVLIAAYVFYVLFLYATANF